MHKILIVSNEFPPTIGGAGILAKDIALQLTKFGYSVTVATSHKNAPYNVHFPFALIPVRSIRFIRYISYWLKLRKLLHSYDFIFLNDDKARILGSLFFNKAFKQKSIVFIHGGEALDTLMSSLLKFKFLNLKKKYVDLLHQSKKVFVVSNHLKYKCEKYTDKVFKFSSGVDSLLFYYDPIDIKATLSIPQDNVLLLSVSRIVKNKGYNTKYLVFKEIIKHSPKFHWIIIGNGDYLNEFRNMVYSDNLQNYISFVGEKPREILRYYYSSCDVFWLLSNFEEGFGLVYAEAAMCGLPSIGFNREGVKDSIIDQKTGYLVESFDDSFNLIINKEYEKLHRKDIIKAAENKYSIRNSIQKIVKVLSDRF